MGATASLVFNGMQFTYTYLTASNRGNIEVWVEGVKMTTLNANSATMVWQKIYTSPALSAGTHTVTFKLAETAGQYMDVDAIRITNPDAIAPSAVG